MRTCSQRSIHLKHRQNIHATRIAMLAALAMPLAGFAPEAPEPPPIDLDILDTDGDGRLRRSEAQANPALDSEFDGVDGDRDGYLDREELPARNR